MRKVLACLFVLAAAAAVGYHMLAITEGARWHPMAHLALATFAAMSAITALYLFRPLATWYASLVCPKCHRAAVLSPCTLGQPHPSLLVLLLGGIVLTILIQHSQPRRFRCAACSAEFSLRTFGSWLAVAWCIAILIFIAAAADVEP